MMRRRALDQDDHARVLVRLGIVLGLHGSVASAANAAFVDEGFTFTAAGSDRSFTMTFEPTGGRTVTLTGASITQAFGAPVSASGEPSNMDGLTFESMDDVLAELNAQFEALDIPVVATYSRGGDTFNFL